MLKDVEAMLDLAGEQLDEIESIYEETLHEQEVSGRLKALVKNVIENYRSSLDFTANAVTAAHGSPGKANVYWPYATDAAKFSHFFDKCMPDVRKKRPDLADAWEKCQPYQHGYEWLGVVLDLARSNKHHTLTPQVRTEQRRREAGDVSWDPSGAAFGAGSLTLGPGGGMMIGPGGQVTIGPNGVFINNERVEPFTQRTPSTRDVNYIDWLFDGLGVSALGVLKETQTKIVPMLHDLCSLAGL